METDPFFYQLLKQLPETLFALLGQPLERAAEYRFEITEEVLIRRFHDLDREEIRRMFKLHEICKTRVWQEAREEGLEEGIDKGIEKGRTLANQELVKRLRANGQLLKEIAQLLGLSLSEVRRFAAR